MIEINLLPQDEGKKSGKKSKAGANPLAGKAASGFSPMIALFALVVFGVVGATGWHFWGQIDAAKQKQAGLKADKKKLDAEIAAFSEQAEEIRKLRVVFANQWEVLQALDPPDRILWCEKVNMLADLIPSHVFLDRLELKENVIEIELESSKLARERWAGADKKTRGAEPVPVKKPVITYRLTLTGLATGHDNTEQMANMMKFHDAMKAHEMVAPDGSVRQFMDNFNTDIQFVEVQATLFEGVPVNAFTFTLTTLPQTSKTPENDASKAMTQVETQTASVSKKEQSEG